VSPAEGSRTHGIVRELPRHLRRGDLLVLNDTKVIPARLAARKPSGGLVETFLLRRLDSGETPQEERWEGLLRGMRGAETGETLAVGSLSIEIERRDGDVWALRLRTQDGTAVAASIERHGRTPLPPYVHRSAPDPSDRERYQTVFAERPGAVAAPTAGLHFTPRLLAELHESGIECARLTLHVGWGTFAPVRVDTVEAHSVRPEAFELPERTADAVAAARRRGAQVVAVGTTTARVLEHCSGRTGDPVPGRGDCDLYITPGYAFRTVDRMLTNFHLPKSSLLFLVSAFHGRDRVLEAYREAVGLGYRFYSYGDATLLERA